MAKERTSVRNRYQDCKIEKLFFAKKIHANSNKACLTPDTAISERLRKPVLDFDPSVHRPMSSFPSVKPGTVAPTRRSNST